ncbi:MAG: hypothetical protein ACREQV_24730 [Candidatus Binatia bacterium]
MSEVNYSIALRCIAQDLERRGLKDFSIMRDGSHFVVQSTQRDGLAVAPEIVRYTPADIEMMDRCGETRRGNQASQEFMHRAQILRAVGDYLDKYNSTLTSITYNDVALQESPLRVEYISREGERVIDDRPGAAIFDMCVLMFQKRSQMSRPQGRHPRGQR